MKIMGHQPVELFVSYLGGADPRILARFTRNEQGLHIERLDRAEGRWVPDSALAGYDLGLDDWAQPASKEQAVEIIVAWGFAATLVDAPVTVVATA